MESSVLVVGAGPVGLAIAALLRMHGLGVRVIERSEGPTPFSKAVGIHARTLECMHALGVTEQLVGDGRPLHGFALHESRGTLLQAAFDDIDSAYPFVLGLPQSRTERRLLARLEALGGRVEWGSELQALDDIGQAGGDAARVRLRHADGRIETQAFSWTIGADGGRSTVRQQAGIAFDGGDYGRAFILGDIRLDWDGPKEKLQFFLSRHGYLLVVPMPAGLHRIIAQTDGTYDDFQGTRRPTASLEALQQIVARNGPPGMRVHSPQWVTCAPFYHRLAATPLKGRVVLAGDAFHLFSPLGAQGLNTGFQDAFNLAWKLAYVEKGWADGRLLDSYASERLAIAQRIAKATHKITRFVTATAAHERLLRFLGSWICGSSETVQRVLPRMLAGQLQSYGRDAFLSDGADDSPVQAGMPQPGARLPHAWVRDAAGTSSYRPLASLLHGTRYTLLAVTDRVDAQAAADAQSLLLDPALASLPFTQGLLAAREIEAQLPALPAHVSVLNDQLGSVAKALGRPARGLVLVRPDGFCALSLAEWSASRVLQYFAERGLGVDAGARRPAAAQQDVHHV